MHAIVNSICLPIMRVTLIAAYFLHAEQGVSFPVSFWWGPPSEHNTRAAWQTVADAGFTFAGPNRLYSEADNQKMLDFCNEVGLKALVSDQEIKPWMTRTPDWRQRLAAKVKLYRRHPALLGYFISDEPHAGYFSALRSIQDEFRNLGENRLLYSVLFPNSARPSQLFANTYKEYLSAYIKIVEPDVLSWDHYPIIKRSQTYFLNLEQMRQQGDRTNMELWQVIQGSGWAGRSDPTKSELLWQIHSSLAYGVRGLLYFYYWPPKGERWLGGGIVDAGGNPRPIYHTIAEVNQIVHNWGKHLLALEPIEVYHSGDLPQGTRPAPANFMVQPKGDVPLIMSYMRSKDLLQKFIFLVNRNAKDAETIQLKFANHIRNVSILNVSQDRFESVAMSNQTYELSLGAGQAVLLRLDAKKSKLDFPFQEHDEGFEWINGSTSARVSEKRLLLPVGRESYLHHEALSIPRDTVAQVQISLQAPHDTRGILFWRTPSQPFYGHNKSLVFNIKGGKETRVYGLNVSQFLDWKESSIIGLRLDLDYDDKNVGQEIEIESIFGLPH